MAIPFDIAAAIAVIATALVVININVVHALLCLVISLLAVAVVFYLLGAPFAAALEVIVYAGAIMVLFVFVLIMLNTGRASTQQERRWLTAWIWLIPVGLSAVLLAEFICLLWRSPTVVTSGTLIGPRQVGALLFGPYLLATELASMLLLAGLIGAYHLGRPEPHEMGENGGINR